MRDNRYRSGSGRAPYAGRSGRGRTLAVLLLGMVLAGQALAQALTARLDRTQITEGESVRLLLSVSGDTQGRPDLGPLETDFDILGQSQGSRVNIINGHGSSTHEWQLVLMPKRSGELTIPALQVGALQSRPLHLKVLSASAAQSPSSGADQPVMLEIEADPEQPYVQGEVTYRVRVLSRVPLREASLSEPTAGDAIVEPLGEDSRYTTERNGTTYQVIERHYAIFPQHSGAVKVEGPVLSASIPVQGGGRRSLRQRFFGSDPFNDIEQFLGHTPFADFPDVGGLFEETRPVRIRSREVTLGVRPQPAGVQGSWLPARSVTLTEAWSPDPPVFRVGEPVTRTIALIADGLSAAQLPDLTPPVPDGMKRYPDQPQSASRTEDDSLIVTKTQQVALVPTAPGTLTLPDFKIPWWDTSSQQRRVATLPGRTIKVLPASAGSGNPAAVPATPAPSKPTTAAAATPPATPAPDADTSAAPAPQTGTRPAYWPWLAGAALAAWLVTLLLWLRARGHRHDRPARPAAVSRAAPSRRQMLAQHRTHVQNACLSNDPKAARAALLDWAAVQWPDAPPRGLSGLAAQVADAAAQRTIVALDRTLYDGSASHGWDGRSAWPVLEPALAETAPSAVDAGTAALPELYPRHVAGS